MSSEVIAALATVAVLLAAAATYIYATAPAPVRAVDLLMSDPAARRAGRDWRTPLEESGLGRALAADLRRGGMSMRSSTLMLLSLGLLLVLGLTLNFVVGIVAAALPFFVVRRRAGQHAKQFAQQLPAVLDLIANALRAGQSEAQAFALVAEQTKGAAGAEFTRMHQALGLGATVDGVTTGLLERLPSPDLELVVDAIQLAHRVGGNLAEMLGGIATTIRNRSRLEGEVRALTAQGRASVYLVTALAPVGLLIISFINPAWGETLFNTTAGRAVLITAAVLELVGYVTATRASAVEV